MLLAIDTATRLAGIALYDENGLHAEQMWRTHDNHTVELMPYVVRACQQQGLCPASLRAVAVSLGPGSFTGMRVGLSVAKGLALALRIPLLGVPSLDATVHAFAQARQPVCAILPAGRRRWVTALYFTAADGWRRRSAYALVNESELLESIREPTVICGEFDTHLAQVLHAGAPGLAILASPALAPRRAGYLAELAWKRFEAGEQDDLASLSPIYLPSA